MKRGFDFIVALVLLVVLSPLMLAIAIVVRAKIGTPVLFRQDRPGYRGKIFALYKFRTMNQLRSQDGALLSDAERLAPFGRWLRASSLDELPELWNVLRGDMSLVGPRPLLVEYLSRYTCSEARRHDVRPGITGWSQVNGRNATTWEHRLRLDVWYVENRNFWLDCRIIARTAAYVIRREGISAPGSATMPEFRPPAREA